MLRPHKTKGVGSNPTFCTGESMITKEEMFDRYRLNTTKRAKKLLIALEHIKTSNIHDRNGCQANLTHCIMMCEKDSAAFRIEHLKSACERAESFLYRVIKKYD